MKIVVLVKVVPDTWGERRISTESGLADRAASEWVIDEIGERALEVALKVTDVNPGAEVVMLSMGPGEAETALRKGLAMGATSAVHASDEALLGADLGVTAEVLSAAIRRIGFDAVIAGNLSTDGSGGVIPAMLAEHLGVPHVTSLTEVTWEDSRVGGTRSVEQGTLAVSAALPAVVSITEGLDDPRFPSFKGIMSAKKKPFQTLTVADLGVDLADESRGRSIVIAVAERPARSAGIKFVDEGDAGERLAEYLVNARLA